MIKKLSMMVLGVAIVTLCGMAMPQDKAEAGQVTNQITCAIGGSGFTGAHANTRSFRDRMGLISVNMGWVSTGKNRYIWAKQNRPCSKDNRIVRNVPSYAYTFDLFVRQ